MVTEIFGPSLMTAPGGEDDPRCGKQDISHRDRKDHKDLPVLHFNRSNSALGNGDLNFRPRLITTPGGADDPRRGKTRYFTQRSQRFIGFEFRSFHLDLGNSDL
jgi:hypothetical protein